MKFSTGSIPYGRHWIDKDDIEAVVEALSSDWITQGPRVAQFESAVSAFCGAKHAVAVSSGTAALHAAMRAIGINQGDEVIVPAITFASTANAVVFEGGTPVFADVFPDTLLLDPESAASYVTSRTKAIVAVDYAGQPCDYDALRNLASQHGLNLISDASHSLGAEYKNQKVGTLADLTTFSFHAIKHVATGEGGMILTNRSEWAQRMERFRNHGIDADFHTRNQHQTWSYAMVELGFNYRITDFQCALGTSQLKKLEQSIRHRREIAMLYDEAFASSTRIKPLNRVSYGSHAYHLYVIQLQSENAIKKKAQIFAELRQRGIGVNVHYLPVYLHPFYQNQLKTAAGLCPAAEAAYQKILSIPIHSTLTEEDARDVVSELSQLA